MAARIFAGSLLLLQLTQFATADLARQGAAQITGAPKLALHLRQDDGCDPGNTACPDGLGCCPNGAACDWTSYLGATASIPICDVKCNALSVTCGGMYSKVCCPAGSSCDNANSGMCTAGVGGGLTLNPFPTATAKTTSKLIFTTDDSGASSAGPSNNGFQISSQTTRVVSSNGAAATSTKTTSAPGIGQTNPAAHHSAGGVAQYLLGGVAAVLAAL